MYSSSVGILCFVVFTLFTASLFIRSLEASVGALDFSFDRELGNVSGSFLRTPYALLLMIHRSDSQR